MAKATFPAVSQTTLESAKPADADGFVASDHRNAYSAVFQGDLAILRPRAKSPATLAVNVVASEIEGFFRNIYWNNTHVKFAGGDSPTFPAPTTNPRIDLLVLDVSGGPTGVLTRIAGTEAASPAEPALPDLKTNIPICYVYTRVGQVKIVNFEDSGANPTEGYLYRDVRPWVPPGGGASFGVAPGSSAIGDTAAEGASASAARADHRHGRESAGTPVTQAFGDAAGAGSAAAVARSDHRHGMPAQPSGGGWTNMQVFTSSGTWVRPAGVSKVLVKCIGGGGGGGGGGSGGTWNGGGGGGGAYGEEIVTVAGDVSVTVGGGGGGGACTGGAGSSGSAGGTSSFGSSVSAGGGSGGGSSVPGPGGSGGTSTAAFNITGATGKNGALSGSPAPGGAGAPSGGFAGTIGLGGDGGNGGNGNACSGGGGSTGIAGRVIVYWSQ